MKKLLIVLALAMLGLANAAQASGPFSLHYNATFVPVNHEPVIGALVARYRVQLTPAVELGIFRHQVDINAWAGQKWRRRSMLGAGFIEKYRNSDWSVETWRFSFLHTTTVDLVGDRLQLFSEFYMPAKRHEWGGHGMENNYYWLTGFSGRIW